LWVIFTLVVLRVSVVKVRFCILILPTVYHENVTVSIGNPIQTYASFPYKPIQTIQVSVVICGKSMRVLYRVCVLHKEEPRQQWRGCVWPLFMACSCVCMDHDRRHIGAGVGQSFPDRPCYNSHTSLMEGQ